MLQEKKKVGGDNPCGIRQKELLETQSSRSRDYYCCGQEVGYQTHS